MAAGGRLRERGPGALLPGDHRPGADQVARALEVCAHCPVAQACLEWAMETGQLTGVWGGVSATQRRSVRRPAGARLPAAH